MSEDFILTVVKIEGLGDVSASDCTIEFDDKQKFSSPLKNLPITFKGLKSNKLFISISDSATNTKIASLSFPLQLLPSDWFYWLPLFLSTDNFIDQLPISITSPRILLASNKQFFNTPRQDFHKDSNCASLKHKNTAISIQESDLITHYQEIIKDLELELLQVKETCKQKCEKLKKTIKKYKDDFEHEKKHRIDLMNKIEKVLKCVEVNTLKVDNRKIVFGDSVEVRNEIFTMEDRPLITIFEETGKYDADLEGRVKEILSRMDFCGLLRKCREVNYRIGAKTITLCLKQGEVCCKNGLSLEKYLFNCCKGEIENFLRNRKSPRRNTSKNQLFF